VSIAVLIGTAKSLRLEMPGRQDAGFCVCAVQEGRISVAVTMGVRVSTAR
jgi:hypothetical protein